MKNLDWYLPYASRRSPLRAANAVHRLADGYVAFSEPWRDEQAAGF